MVHGRYRMAFSQGDKLVASCVKKRAGDNDDSGNVLALNVFECFVDRCIITDPKISNLQAEGMRCLAQIAKLRFVGWEIRIEKSADYRNVRQQLPQQLKALGLQRGG